MRFQNVSIQSLAYVDPPHRISSADLEARFSDTLERLGIPRGFVEQLSGVEARRFWDEGVRPSDVATQAAEKAISRAGIDRAKLGILVNTSVCRDFIEPSTACLVHGNLGLEPTCLNFDVSNACLGFLNGMALVANMIERGQVDYGLVVDGEDCRFVVEKTLERFADDSADDQLIRDDFATLTLGSGAAAMVLTRTELATTTHRFLGGVALAATEHNGLCRGQVDRMTTNSEGLLESGVKLANETWALASKELGWNGDLDEYVLHQVSRVHTEKITDALGIDRDKVLAIYPEHGNIGPAAVPIALAKSAEQGRITEGDRVALMGIGSGLNCAMVEVVW